MISYLKPGSVANRTYILVILTTVFIIQYLIIIKIKIKIYIEAY